MKKYIVAVAGVCALLLSAPSWAGDRTVDLKVGGMTCAMCAPAAEKALKKAREKLDYEIIHRVEVEGWMQVVRQAFKQHVLNGLPRMTYTNDGWVETGYMLKRQWKSAICKLSAGVRADARMLALYVKEYERKYKETVPIRKIGVAYPTDWAEFNSDDTE